MLPVTPWLHAMNIEATLPQRYPWPVGQNKARGLRRAVGRRLIAVGVALAGEPAQQPAWAAR